MTSHEAIAAAIFPGSGCVWFLSVVKIETKFTETTQGERYAKITERELRISQNLPR
jgi:hypothetical protein